MQARFGEFLFDSATRELKRGEEEIRLAPKAFQLLELLLERAPEAVSQEMIYERLWPTSVVNVANLHNLVSQIRLALGDDDHAIVRTVYRFGFSFSAALEALSTSDRQPSRFVVLVDGVAHSLFEGSNLVGREALAPVRILMPSISRRHAIVAIHGTDAVVEDLGSKNGTFVGNRRIDGPTAVRPGISLQFGRVEARFLCCESDEATLSEPST